MELYKLIEPYFLKYCDKDRRFYGTKYQILSGPKYHKQQNIEFTLYARFFYQETWIVSVSEDCIYFHVLIDSFRNELWQRRLHACDFTEESLVELIRLTIAKAVEIFGENYVDKD